VKVVKFVDPKSNYLISRLPASDFERLTSHFELISLQQGQVLYEPDVPVHSFYFPVDAVISLYVLLGDGYTAESASVGRLSMLPLSLLAGGCSLNRAVVRTSGFAYRIPSDVLRAEFRRGEGLMQVLLEAMKWMFAKISLSSVCSRHHSIDQQVAQWLLLSIDSTQTNAIKVTHEQIARMLGFRREGVTHTLGKFLSQLVISSVRGQIEVVNRPALEKIVCQCYWDQLKQEKYSRATDLLNA
jgi:CRP-like cAMP-binding protein